MKARKIKFGVLVACLALSLVGCKKKGGLFCYKANENVVTESRDLSGFNEVSIEMGADVSIRQGEEYKVEITTSENIMELIKIKVKNSNLIIGLKKSTCIKNSSDVEIDITLPELIGIDISGSADVDVIEDMDTDHLNVDISGSGDIRFDKLRVEQLDVNISGSGSLKAGGSELGNLVDVRISGSGELDLLNLQMREADINVSGSGECRVYITEHLNVKVSGSGHVKYKGNPATNENISGSGSVKPY